MRSESIDTLRNKRSRKSQSPGPHVFFCFSAEGKWIGRSTPADGLSDFLFDVKDRLHLRSIVAQVNKGAILTQSDCGSHARHNFIGNFIGALGATQENMIGIQSISYRLALLFGLA